MAKSKTSQKLKEMSVTHGALASNQTITALMGRDRFPYKEQTLAEYDVAIGKMDTAELQHHAVESANIIPNVDKRSILVNKLREAYIRQHTRFFTRAEHLVLPELSDAAKRFIGGH